MNWLITGGCGFIGSSLIASLLAEGRQRIRVVDDLSVGSVAALTALSPVLECSADDLGATPGAGSVEFVKGDIRDAGLAEKVARSCDVIVHLAANAGVEQSVRNPRHDCDTNVFGTLNYLEAARRAGVSRFVMASSSAAVGEVEPPIHEQMAVRPVSPYGASKLAGEAYCAAYHGTYGIETVALRFGNVYGPGSSHKGSVVAKFIRRAMQGESLEVYGDGSQSRDFVFVGDLVRAIVAGARAEEVGGEVFQIATSRELSVKELIDVLLPILERNGIGPVDVRHEERRAGDVMRSYADTRKAKERLGWVAETDIAAGLERTVAWFQERLGAPGARA